MDRPTFMIVEPSELIFDVEGGRLDECKLKITNICQHRLGYKLLTDHNDNYIFSPKSGFVGKGEIAEVSVKLVQIPNQPTAVDHVTMVKARIAKDDEVDRDKEWRTATREDEARMQIVRLKSRFRITKPIDEDVITHLRRIERQIKGLLEDIRTITMLLIAVLVIGLINLAK